MNERKTECVKGRYPYEIRKLWKRAGKKIPEGMLLCHKCDDGWCINFDHVFLGTHKDNTQDMLSKGRHWVPRGEASPHCKMSDKDVEYVKKHYVFRGKNGNNGVALAKHFGVTQQQITRIARGER